MVESKKITPKIERRHRKAAERMIDDASFVADLGTSTPEAKAAFISACAIGLVQGEENGWQEALKWARDALCKECANGGVPYSPDNRETAFMKPLYHGAPPYRRCCMATFIHARLIDRLKVDD